MDPDEAVRDFRARIAHYEEAYETLEQDEGSSVRLIDAGRRVEINQLDGYLASRLVFYLTNLVIVVIMLVAVYVHLRPNVPAEVLPFQSKPPVVTLIVMGLAMLNAWLRRRNTTSIAAWA